MISDFAHSTRRCSLGRRTASLQSGLLARTRTRARTHEFNVPKELDCPRNPCRKAGNRLPPSAAARASRCAAPASTARACSRSRRSPRASASSNTPAASSPGSRRRSCRRTTPTIPTTPSSSISTTSTSSTALDGGNAAKWINHACGPNCEADEVGDRIFITALRDIEPGRGAQLRLRADPRRQAHQESEEGVRLPLRDAASAGARCSPRRSGEPPRRPGHRARRRDRIDEQRPAGTGACGDSQRRARPSRHTCSSPSGSTPAAAATVAPGTAPRAHRSLARWRGRSRAPISRGSRSRSASPLGRCARAAARRRPDRPEMAERSLAARRRATTRPAARDASSPGC